MSKVLELFNGESKRYIKVHRFAYCAVVCIWFQKVKQPAHDDCFYKVRKHNNNYIPFYILNDTKLFYTQFLL